MANFLLKLKSRISSVEFTDSEVSTLEDFMDDEREKVLSLEVGVTITLFDGAEVKRVS